MNWFDKFKRRWRNFGIPNLMTYVVLTMMVVFIADGFLRLGISNYLFFSRTAIMSGQIWRLITFIFLPPSTSAFWILIALLFYYNIGRELERSWGTSTFTLYYIIGIVGTIISGFITGYADNLYLNLSLMLAYVQLYPDATFRFYFLIPIKAKYIGYAQLALYGLSILMNLVYKNWSAIGSLLASLLNFIVFFAPGMIKGYKQKQQIKKRQRDYRRNLRNPDDDDFNSY